MIDRAKLDARTRNMKAIKSAGMKPEMCVRRTAHMLGFRFRLHRHELPGRPDIVFPSRQKIIFVHGCFWHQHRVCKLAHFPKSNLDYWKPKLVRNVERDRRNVKNLRRLGWRVLVIWECETKQDVKLGIRIKRFLNS
ncbi:MAG: very short patch repair endonuclease [Stellaceae bacterium]